MAGGSQQGSDTRGETVIITDKTLVCSEPVGPLIFGWLLEVDGARIMRIASDQFSIGKAKKADLAVEAKEVKDLHCFVYFIGDHFEINDNNTASGTRVNGKPVKRQNLADNDVISVGNANFLFKCFSGNFNER